MTEELDTSPAPPAMPVLPDGMGMDLDEVARLLAEKHKALITPDDPVLMLVTIHNAFLAQENALMDRHKSALAQVMAGKTDGFVQAVQKVADQMGQTLASSTVESMRTALDRHRRDMLWLSAIVVISALVNVGVFLLR